MKISSGMMIFVLLVLVIIGGTISRYSDGMAKAACAQAGNEIQLRYFMSGKWECVSKSGAD